MAKGTLKHATKSAPCQVCGGGIGWCGEISRYFLCMRVESPRPAAKGGWLHPKESQYANAPIPPRPKPISDDELEKRFAPIISKCSENALDRQRQLAVLLGVSVFALASLVVGYSEVFPGGASWMIPERNAKGQVIGISRRLVVPRGGKNKLAVKGSRRGLTYPDNFKSLPGAVYITEGASDVMAGLTLGLCTIGRPSATGGVEQLAELLCHCKRQIIVLGENDRKDALYLQQTTPPHNPDCQCCARCWPGKFWATQTA
jgi:hypothetical protein